MVNRSFTEAEIVPMSDDLSEVLWFRKWITAQGHILPPTILYKTMKLLLKQMKYESKTQQRTRFFYATEH